MNPTNQTNPSVGSVVDVSKAGSKEQDAILRTTVLSTVSRSISLSVIDSKLITSLGVLDECSTIMLSQF